MITLVLLIALSAQPTAAKKEKPQSSKQRTTTQPVIIHSDHFQAQEKKHTATYLGHVRVNRGNVDIACDRMVVDYQDSIDDVTKIVCRGNVNMTDGEKKAHSQQADFDNVNGVLVLTGAPELHRGSTVIRGSKITYHTETDDLAVEDATIMSDTAKGAGALTGSGHDGGTRAKRDGGTVR